MNLLELKHISFDTTEKDGRTRHILNAIDFSINTGDFVAITGPNGSGKTMLSKIIMGIEQPTSGQILWRSKDITSKGVTDRANLGIGFALQQPVKFKGFEVRDILGISAGKRLSAKVAGSHLEQVGLPPADYLERELDDKLSGGEMKRIEIATLLARDPDLYLFDEPEAGIDLWSFQSLIKIFKTLADSKKKAIIVITHQERILKIADKVVVLRSGKLSESSLEKVGALR